jgi:hypothetical protein
MNQNVSISYFYVCMFVNPGTVLCVSVGFKSGHSPQPKLDQELNGDLLNDILSTSLWQDVFNNIF